MASKGMKGLLVWCKKHTEGYRDVHVTNMTSSWKDGLAFCALLHRFRPDLIDFDSLSKENVLYNNQLAFDIAERELEIAALLDAEDMANMKVPDKLSVMTYLAQYYNCFRHCNPVENVTQTDSQVINPEVTGSPAKTTVPLRRSTDESICCICGKRVHLVQRYFEEGKLYHRTCHRNDSLKKIRGKNYFVKQENKQDTKEVGNSNKHDDEKSAFNTGPDASKPISTKPDNIPSLVESLGHTTVKTVNVGPTPSPSTETRPPPSALPSDTPSLISELPRPKKDVTTTTDSILAVPKPRTRTIRSSETSTDRTSPPPVAQPRKKIGVETEKAIPNKKEDIDYDDSLNPFGSGSDSDTTLSSTTSEDEANPFKKTSNKSPTEVGVGSVDKVVDQSDAKKVDDVNFTEKVHAVNAEDGYGNPFGDSEDTTAEPVEATSDKFNPFSPDFEDNSPTTAKNLEMAKKKKRPAPIPPKVTSPVLQKANYPAKKKAAAPRPPRPANWKAGMGKKMEELNKDNEKDPRYSKSNSPKPQRPAPLQSAAKKTPAGRSPKKVTNPKSRSAPGYGFPLVKRKVEIKMSEEEITTELKVLDIKLSDYETKGVKLEEMLRFAMDSDTEWTSEEDQLLQEWFELVNKKNILLRQETDLVFTMQQQRFEQEYADIEFQLRKLFNKPESAKTERDKAEEEELLQKLLENVERRNVIITSIEEERLKEAEEDSAYEQMKRLQKNPSKKKKKNKVKKIFSKREKGRVNKEAHP